MTFDFKKILEHSETFLKLADIVREKIAEGINRNLEDELVKSQVRMNEVEDRLRTSEDELKSTFTHLRTTEQKLDAAEANLRRLKQQLEEGEK